MTKRSSYPLIDFLQNIYIVCMFQAQIQEINVFFFPADINTLKKVDDIHQAILIFLCFLAFHPFNFTSLTDSPVVSLRFLHHF